MTATILLSDNGASSGSAGYKLTGGTDGTLQLQTATSGGAATTAMTIDTSQNVGINASPTTGYRLIVDNGEQVTGQYSSITAKGGSISSNGGQIALINSYGGVSNPNKYLRVDNTGAFSIVNSAYSTGIFTLTDSGGLTVGSRGVAKSSMPAGSILQVVSTTVTAVVTTTVSSNSTFYAISGLAATITPTSSTSKIYAMVQLVGSGTSGYSYVCAFQLWRAGSPVGQGDAASGFRQASVGNTRASLDGNSNFAIGWNYLDSPATTSATTYQVACTVEGGNVVLNTTANNSTGIYSSRSASSITLFEVAV
jgi:hypothetical protein